MVLKFRPVGFTSHGIAQLRTAVHLRVSDVVSIVTRTSHAETKHIAAEINACAVTPFLVAKLFSDYQIEGTDGF